MQLFDTHAHLSDARFDYDRNELLNALPMSGVRHIVDCACNRRSFEQVASNCEKYPYIRAAYGIHPHDVSDIGEDDMSDLAEWLRRPECVALGEVGLDYHYEFSPREVQRQRFVEQLELAAAANKPVIVHDREAHSDILSILKAFKDKVTGVLHCYSGSAEMARDFLSLGFYISFAGAVTFAKSGKSHFAAKAIPSDRILIETDCPYLAPHPYRGKRNDPSYIRFTCERIAELRGVSTEEFAELTLANGKRIFGLA